MVTFKPSDLDPHLFAFYTAILNYSGSGEFAQAFTSHFMSEKETAEIAKDSTKTESYLKTYFDQQVADSMETYKRTMRLAGSRPDNQPAKESQYSQEINALARPIRILLDIFETVCDISSNDAYDKILSGGYLKIKPPKPEAISSRILGDQQLSSNIKQQARIWGIFSLEMKLEYPKDYINNPVPKHIQTLYSILTDPAICHMKSAPASERILLVYKSNHDSSEAFKDIAETRTLLQKDKTLTSLQRENAVMVFDAHTLADGLKKAEPPLALLAAYSVFVDENIGRMTIQASINKVKTYAGKNAREIRSLLLSETTIFPILREAALEVFDKIYAKGLNQLSRRNTQRTNPYALASHYQECDLPNSQNINGQNNMRHLSSPVTNSYELADPDQQVPLPNMVPENNSNDSGYPPSQLNSVKPIVRIYEEIGNSFT